MRKLNRIILHCSATEPGHDIGADVIRTWHKARGWSDIGYHYVIRLNGVIESGRSLDRIGAHVKNHNADSIGICYIGGLDVNGDPANTMNGRQLDSLKRLCYALCVTLNQPLMLHGHNEYSTKACPSFTVADTLEELKSWCASYQRRFIDQRPPASLELTQYSSGAHCTCGNRECDS